MLKRLQSILMLAVLAACCGCQSPVSAHTAAAKEPAHLSSAAELGRRIFFDRNLSASGKQNCASCHDPAFAYAPANARAVQLGGVNLNTPGLRAVPSLRYTMARTPVWSHPRPVSLAEQLVETDGGPAGGFTWDGRFNTLHEQAAFPLLQPSEMASSKTAIVHAIEMSAYAVDVRAVCGTDSFAAGHTEQAFACVLRALERFELEDGSFHPYSSRYDLYLDGKTKLTAQEERGLKLFNDDRRGNCASCHLSAKGADGSHPLFTDFQFEAIAVPRNPEIPANHDPAFYDLGLCGPLRTDQPSKPYCGMFKTPSLRNVATRRTFFHNGRFHTLKESLEFYVQRDTNPDKWYAHGTQGFYDDLPLKLRENVDRKTLPFMRTPGKAPVWNDEEIDDVIAFLKTLNDADMTSNLTH